MKSQMVVGLDVSARTFSVSIDEQPAFHITQSAAGYQQLIAWLLGLGCPVESILCVMEATGTYFMPLAAALHRAGFKVGVVNPLKIHFFAKTLRQRTKTDSRDAQLLAAYGRCFPVEAWTPPPPIYEALQQRLVQRDNLIRARTQLTNQHHARHYRQIVIHPLEGRADDLLALLHTQIRQVDAEIAALLVADTPWCENARLLLSIPCLGQITAAWLLVATHNFQTIASGEQLAAFAGLVPYVRQSGSSLAGHQRVRYSGHKRLRIALYIATLNAARFNPAIAPFYARLREKGKPSKVVRIACARKLAHIAFAVVRDKQAFNIDL